MASGRSDIAVWVSRRTVAAALLLWCGVAVAVDIDSIVEGIADREVELKAPSGVKEYSKEELKEFLEKKGVDVEAMEGRVAEQREAMNRAHSPRMSANQDTPQSRLLMFVSMSMPGPSIQRVLDDAARAGATVVVNGMTGRTMAETKNVIRDLTGRRQVGWQIDPASAKKYGVVVAPTTVLALGPVQRSSCDAANAGQCIDEPFYGIEGDVSLEYALEKLIHLAPEAEREARLYLGRLRREN